MLTHQVTLCLSIQRTDWVAIAFRAACPAVKAPTVGGALRALITNDVRVAVADSSILGAVAISSCQVAGAFWVKQNYTKV